MNDKITRGIWQALASTRIDLKRAPKQLSIAEKHIRNAAHHIACNLFTDSAQRAEFTKACGF